MPEEKRTGEQPDMATQAMLGIVQGMAELAKNLANMKTNEDTSWFRNLLLGIVNAGLHDYRLVQIGIAKSPHLAAWGARSLLELQIVTSSVLESEEKALQFRDELLTDITEFWQAIIENNAVTHRRLIEQMRRFGGGLTGAERDVILKAADQEEKKGAPNTESLNELKAYKQLMGEAFGPNKKSLRRHGDIARETKERAMFDSRNKIYSKIVHRTALSIATTIMGGSLDELMPLLRGEASNYLLAIYFSIKEHLDKYGLSTKHCGETSPVQQ